MKLYLKLLEKTSSSPVLKNLIQFLNKDENFFAVRFVNRKLIDITNEIKEELKLND